MKRYVCTVAIGLLLALVSTGTATAQGLPVPGQTGTQVTSFGDQTVGEQKNDADVTQAQGNGNLNIAPAVSILGDAESTNAQGNGNTATAAVDQSNSVDQSQSSIQTQSLDQGGGSCCGGQSQTGEQKTDFGDQTVGEQKNDADVTQKQGNWNGNFAPAIAFGGHKGNSCSLKCEKFWLPSGGNAETSNRQGNWNTAMAEVDQSNSVDQSQAAHQRQFLVSSGKGLVYR
jgi:hypothetical protein